MAGFFDSLFSGGKEKEDLQKLQEKVQQDPENFHLLVKMGDLLQKMKRPKEALESYRQASAQYIRKGFLIQAIAVYKIILRLDPTQLKIRQELANLYSQRGMVDGEKKGDRVAEQELGKIPLFSDLPREELGRLIEKVQARQFSRGTIICHEGQAGDSIFVLSRGKVKIFHQDSQGKRTSLADLGEGSFFGEFGFFAGSGRKATVMAVEDTEVLEIAKTDLRSMIQEFPGVQAILFKFYKERVLKNLLGATPLFHSLPLERREETLGLFTREEFPAGAWILKEGGPGDAFYIIIQGEVEIFTYDAQEAVLPLARLREGDYFGEISLLTGQPRSASARALQAVELARLGKNDFDQIRLAHPEVQAILDGTSHLRAENKLRALGIFQNNPAKEGMV
jgi:cAMP-dependent protein kinase regulator